MGGVVVGEPEQSPAPSTANATTFPARESAARSRAATTTATSRDPTRARACAPGRDATRGGAEVGRGERPLAPTDAATPPGERRQARSGAGHRTGRESETRHTTGGARDPRIGQSRDRWGGEESCGRRATREGAGGGGPGGSRERLKSRRAQRGVSPPEAHAHEGGPAAPRNAKRPASIEPAGHPNRGGGHSSAQRGAGTPTRHRPTSPWPHRARPPHGTTPFQRRVPRAPHAETPRPAAATGGGGVGGKRRPPPRDQGRFRLPDS